MSKDLSNDLKQSFQKTNSYGVLIVFASIIITLVGFLMLYSSSYAGIVQTASDSSQWYFISRQSIALVLALVFALFFYRLGRSVLVVRKYVFYGAFVVSVALLIFTIFFGEGVNGSARWINIGPLNLQPSEMVKIFYVMVLGSFLSKRREKLFVSFLLFLIVPGMIAIENLSTALILVFTTVIMFAFSNFNLKSLLYMSVPMVIFSVVFIMREEYRIRRINEYVAAFKNPMLSQYQTKQSLYAIANGKVFGQGLTNSIQKFYYLPEHHTDFIFAIIGEELGLFGSTVLIVLYGVLVVSILMVSKYTENRTNQFITLGFGAMVGIQVILNLGVVSGAVPATGVTLPLISYGGSSLIFTIFLLAFVLGVAFKKKGQVNENKEK